MQSGLERARPVTLARYPGIVASLHRAGLHFVLLQELVVDVSSVPSNRDLPCFIKTAGLLNATGEQHLNLNRKVRSTDT